MREASEIGARYGHCFTVLALGPGFRPIIIIMGIVFPAGLVMDKLNELYRRNRWENITVVNE